MSVDRIVLGPNPELLAEARKAWPQRQRAREDRGGKWSSLAVELKPVVPFFEIVRKIGERAAERGEVGEGGGYVWSIPEWQRFIRASQESSHLTLASYAVGLTVHNVELMLADGKNARQIHAALYWRAKKEEGALQAEREREVRQHASAAAASFETRVQEKILEERARMEARRRVKAEFESEDGPRGGRRVAV